MQGNQLGVDYHDPRGFGLFRLAAAFWQVVGPHYYVLRASADVFAIVIVVCAYAVAVRQLRQSVTLATLFCITVAFESSAPSIYGSTQDFGLSMVYDRLIMAGLLVLFVQNFACGWDSARKRTYLGIFVTAVLLNTLFLVKISGPIVGLAIILSGAAVNRRPISQKAGDTAIVLGIFFAMLAADFFLTGTRVGPLIEEYRLAAQARTGAYSLRDLISFIRQLPVLFVVALMIIYSLSQPTRTDQINLWRCWFVIACFWAFQIVLNMSNATESRGLLFLAPGALVSVLTWVDPPATAGFWDSIWKHPRPLTLNNISARHLIPFLIIGIVLAHEGLASFRAMRLDHRIESGVVTPLKIAATDGIVFETFVREPYEHSVLVSLNDGIQAIERLHLGHEVIANIDFSNPFPALFLSPAPKGGSAYWDVGNNLPRGYKLTWAKIIGNACVVTQPKRPVWDGNYQRPLLAAVEPRLEAAFKLVYEDVSWKIWQKRDGCTAAK